MDSFDNILTKRSWWGSGWFMVVIGVLLIIGVIFMITFLNLGKKEKVKPIAPQPEARRELTEQEREDVTRQLSTPSSETAPKVSDAERQKIINSLSN